MMCDNLKAYLDGELRFSDRLAMLIHLKLCDACRRNAAEWPRLSREIERLEGEPVPPALREKLMADAMTAAASARSHDPELAPERTRTKGVFTMRRAFVGTGLIAALMAVLFWLIPGRNGSYALADVARAMANVKSVHVVGWRLDRSGQKKRIEIWAKGGDKFRFEQESNETAVDDGEKLISVRTYEGCTSATINRSKTFPGLEHGMSYLDLFMGKQVLKQLMENGELGLAGSRSTTLPDGRRAVIMELRSGPEKALVTVDEESNLIRQVEAYDEAG
ncbi:MAG: zf-HC2 domain-containing protein, partial [Armatimonadetes bacterium]|nr:zf-HC2 domain-containing protein [Armatimonadota bacterium]